MVLTSTFLRNSFLAAGSALGFYFNEGKVTVNAQKHCFQEQPIRNEIYNKISKNPCMYCWFCMKENHNVEFALSEAQQSQRRRALHNSCSWNSRCEKANTLDLSKII